MGNHAPSANANHIMELLTPLKYGIVVFLFIFTFYLLLFKSSKPKKDGHKAPPEAAGARPFTGHLHVMSTGLPHINLGTLADKYGPIFKIRLGVRYVVVVSSSELVKELFTTNDLVVSCRPTVKSGEHLGYNRAMLGFSPYGAYWRELRKLASLELFSSRRVELERDVRVSETVLSINELYKIWENRKDGSGRVLVDMKKWFGYLSMNVIVRMVVGKRFESEDDVVETRRCREVMRDFFHLAGFFVPADALPYLGWLDLGGYEKRMKRTAKEFDQIVGGWLAEHREKEYSSQDKSTDFMHVMLTTVKGAKFQGKYDVDTIIKATCGTLIAGGTDTTAVVLIWALSLLLNNRHTLKKAQEELDKHVGRERQVNESDVINLVYLQAITKEVLRLYPPGPLAGTRKFTKDCNVGDYYVLKDTWLIVNLSKLHRDPKIWHDPLEFRPERFLGEHKNVDVKGQNFELIPFGAGRRICPGTTFSMHMLHLVLAKLLQAFEFSTMVDEEVDMSESDGLTNMKATPLDLLISPRLNPSVYN